MELLPHKSQRSPSTALLLATIVVVGIFLLSFYNVQLANDQNRRDLEERATTIAAALDTDKIAALTGGPADANLPEYKELKSKLTALRQINSDVRTLYITGARSDGGVFFYVDSEQPGSAYYSEPGEAYSEATPAFKNMFYSAPLPLVEGPVTDHFGTWVSGLSPIFNPKTGRVIAVIGVDVDSVAYNQSLLGAVALPLGGGLFLVVIVAIYEWIRRRDLQLERLRSELVSIASHELRSPLVGIRWALEGLMKSVANRAEEDKLRAITNSVIHMQMGAEDILQFTSFARNNQKLTKKECDMRALVQEVMDTQRLVALQKSVNLVLDDSWPEKVMVMCDPNRMKRALHNLASNAIKYTRSNTAVVFHYEKSKDMHLVSVIDHGIGIPKPEQKRVLAGFYRASNAIAGGIKGTGLGLYLTRAIIAQHHGHLTFMSQEGVGTTFVIALPIR